MVSICIIIREEYFFIYYINYMATSDIQEIFVLYLHYLVY